jgi:hypothetical protein
MSIRLDPTPTSQCRVGFARRDITPPVGIYHRCWGAATHDRATGVHRRVYGDILALAPLEADAGEASTDVRLQILLDIGWLRRPELEPLRQAIAAAVGLAHGQVLITCNHSHSVAHPTLDRVGEPGGELIVPYLEALREKLIDGARAALADLRPVTITYGSGRCDLAVNRDYWDEVSGKFVCGYNPEAPADDTVVVATVTDGVPPAHSVGQAVSPPSAASHRPGRQANSLPHLNSPVLPEGDGVGGQEAGQTVASLVNYACHPTTLAWGNSLISPDYLGACREVVEQATGAPCAFLLGACGDLAPREGYVGDTAVADRNGRQLGYAALAALTALGPPATDFAYTGPVVSGATLGAWEHRPLAEGRRCRAAHFTGGSFTRPLPLIPLPTREEIAARRAEYQRQEAAALAADETERARDCRALAERDTRLLGRLANMPESGDYPFQASVWRVGDAVWVTVEAELYSVFQTTLRQRFPGTPLVITTLTNGADATYLPPRELYGKGIYQEEIALLAPGCLEAITEGISQRIEGVLAD